VLSFFVHRHMAVAEDDQIRLGKPAVESTGSARFGPAIMDHCDLHPAEFEQPALGEKPLELAVVVTEHGIGLGHRLQLCERLSGRDVTGMEHDVGPGQRIEHLGGDTVQPFGEVAVREYDHLHGGDRRFQTPTAPKESCMAAAAPSRWSKVVVISGSTRRVTAHM
jgi:hypothetical protein